MKTKKVIVTVWQPEWQKRFEQLRDVLFFQLAGLVCAIEHVGSTSVPGLAAKPILDVDVVISSSEAFDKVKAKLDEHGYYHRGDLGVRGREAFGYRGKTDLMKHHLYVLVKDSDELRRHLGFRDWLRAHPDDVAAYAKIKLEAAKRFSEDIDAYIEEKSDFITQIYLKAGLIDPADVYAGAWSVLVNRYSLIVDNLECRALKPGVSMCRVSSSSQEYHLLVWDINSSYPTTDRFHSIPTAKGNAVCENSAYRYALFESETQAKEFLNMIGTEEKNDNTQKFSGKAEVYQKARPGYSPELFTCLELEFGLKPGSVAADVGSGTGILTRQLLELGAKVFAVEPNVDMRLVAEKELGDFEGFVSIAGTAEHSGLPEQSVDFIFAASAFHWFDPVVFHAECERILKPDGRVLLIWNETQLTDEIKLGRKRIFEKYSGKKAGGHKELPGVKEVFFDGMMAELHFPNPSTYDKTRFVDRALSSSYALTKEHNHYQDFVNELGELFDHFAVDGLITIPQETVLYFKA